MKWEPTKENPGTYAHMIEYLAELEHTTAYDVIEFKDYKSAVKDYKSYAIHFEKDGVSYCGGMVTTLKGGIRVIQFYDKEAGQITFPIDTFWDRIWANKLKVFKDFATIPQPTKDYKSSEGGGWYCMVSCWIVNGKYFANY